MIFFKFSLNERILCPPFTATCSFLFPNLNKFSRKHIPEKIRSELLPFLLLMTLVVLLQAWTMLCIFQHQVFEFSKIWLWLIRNYFCLINKILLHPNTRHVCQTNYDWSPWHWLIFTRCPENVFQIIAIGLKFWSLESARNTQFLNEKELTLSCTSEQFCMLPDNKTIFFLI